MALDNEKLVGHISFLTAEVNSPPIPIPAPDGTAYNIRVTRLIDSESLPVVGGYVVIVGEALAPPSDESADIDVTSSSPLLWTNANVTDIGTDSEGNRLFQINVVQATPPGSVAASDSDRIVVRFSIRRVNPRRT